MGHGSSNNRLFQRFWLTVKEFWPIKNGWKSYHGEQNQGYHVKEHEKLGKKRVSKVTLHFIWVTFQENKQCETLLVKVIAVLDLFSSSKCNKSAQTVISLGMVQRKKAALLSASNPHANQKLWKIESMRIPDAGLPSWLVSCDSLICIFTMFFYSKANNDPRMKTDCLITHILILPVRPSLSQILQIAFQFPWKMPIFLPCERTSLTASGL